MRNYSSLLAILLLVTGSVKAQKHCKADTIKHAADARWVELMEETVIDPLPSVRYGLHVIRGAYDTVKAIILVYHDGPVPLQIKGWAPRVAKADTQPPSIYPVAIYSESMQPTGAFLYADKRTPIPGDIIYPNGWIIKNW